MLHCYRNEKTPQWHPLWPPPCAAVPSHAPLGHMGPPGRRGPPLLPALHRHPPHATNHREKARTRITTQATPHHHHHHHHHHCRRRRRRRRHHHHHHHRGLITVDLIMLLVPEAQSLSKNLTSLPFPRHLHDHTECLVHSNCLLRGQQPPPLITAQDPSCAQAQVSATPGIPRNYGPNYRTPSRSKHFQKKYTTTTTITIALTSGIISKGATSPMEFTASPSLATGAPRRRASARDWHPSLLTLLCERSTDVRLATAPRPVQM